MFPAQGSQEFGLEEWNIGMLLSSLERMRMPVFLDKQQVTYSVLDSLLTAHPELPVIVRKVYYAEDRKLMPLMERHANLYIDSSICRQYVGIDVYVRSFGAERIVYRAWYRPKRRLR